MILRTIYSYIKYLLLRIKCPHLDYGWFCILQILTDIDKSKKCHMCKKEFPDGILNRNPEKILPIMNMIKSKFLFHLKETHGLDPEMFYLILDIAAKKNYYKITEKI